jgi:hypothetical protein
LPLGLQRTHLVDRIARLRPGLGEALGGSDESLARLAGFAVGNVERLLQGLQGCGETNGNGLRSLLRFAGHSVLHRSQLAPRDPRLFHGAGGRAPIRRRGIEPRACLDQAVDHPVAGGKILVARGLELV